MSVNIAEKMLMICLFSICSCCHLRTQPHCLLVASPPGTFNGLELLKASASHCGAGRLHNWRSSNPGNDISIAFVSVAHSFGSSTTTNPIGAGTWTAASPLSLGVTDLLGEAHDLQPVALPDGSVGASVHQLVHLLHRLDCGDLGRTNQKKRFADGGQNTILKYFSRSKGKIVQAVLIGGFDNTKNSRCLLSLPSLTVISLLPAV